MVEDGVDVPALRERPDVGPDIFTYWEGFVALHKSRTSGFGPNPIQFAEIAAYLALFPVDDVELFVSIVKQLDSEFLKWYDADQKRRTKT